MRVSEGARDMYTAIYIGVGELESGDHDRTSGLNCGLDKLDKKMSAFRPIHRREREYM